MLYASKLHTTSGHYHYWKEKVFLFLHFVIVFLKQTWVKRRRRRRWRLRLGWVQVGRRGRRVGDLLRHELNSKEKKRGGEGKEKMPAELLKVRRQRVFAFFATLEILKESLLETGKQHFPKTAGILRYKVFTLENGIHILYLNKLPIPSQLKVGSQGRFYFFSFFEKKCWILGRGKYFLKIDSIPLEKTSNGRGKTYLQACVLERENVSIA